MKVYPNLAAGVKSAIVRVVLNGESLKYVLDQLFSSHKKWGKRDRNFLFDASYFYFRNYRLIARVTQSPEPEAGLDPSVSADAYLAWLPEQESFESARMVLLTVTDDPTLLYSVPAAWINAWSESKELVRDFQHQQNEAALYVRANVLKISKEALIQHLLEEGFEALPVPNASDALVVHPKNGLKNTEAYGMGWFEIQDVSSQQVAEFCEVIPGMQVLDVCAGAGGKSLHLAVKMDNTGAILSGDVSEYKLKQIVLRSRRAGVEIIQTKLLESGGPEVKGSFDVVLIDAPCSGTGTLRREPDLRLRLKAADIRQRVALQKEILDSYAHLTKPGGGLVYATCSVLREENELQVKDFLNHHPEFVLDAQRRISPETGGDGFFMARMKKVS